jgi:hypothetical protein
LASRMELSKEKCWSKRINQVGMKIYENDDSGFFNCPFDNCNWRSKAVSGIRYHVAKTVGHETDRQTWLATTRTACTSVAQESDVDGKYQS